MKKCILRLIDQVNAKFEGLDPVVRRELVDKMKVMVPYARHTPLFKMGRWDGKVPFSTVGGATYINLLDRAIPIVADAGYDIELIDDRPVVDFKFPVIDESILAHKVWPAGHPLAGEPIMLRAHQVAAINTYFANPQSLQQISTGAGKTAISATISYVCEQYGRTLVIVPSKSLVEQTEDDFRNIGLDVGVFYGDRKEFGHTHTIATWQSLASLGKKSRMEEALIPLDEFLADMVCVQVDECQSAKADSLRDLMCGPMSSIPLRWGMTGTIPKEDFEFLVILASIGPVVGQVDAVTLQDKGILSKCHAHIWQLDDSHVEFKTYDDERAFLTKDPTRLAFLASKCVEIGNNGNTLILVNNIDTGKSLRALIPDSVFISGAVKTKDRKAEYQEVQEMDNKIIIATYGVAAVGINIPRIFNLVMFESGASFTRVIQSIGRALRVAKDKDFADIYDICSNLKFSKRHLAKRKVFYNEAQYPHKTTKMKYR